MKKVFLAVLLTLLSYSVASASSYNVKTFDELKTAISNDTETEVTFTLGDNIIFTETIATNTKKITIVGTGKTLSGNAPFFDSLVGGSTFKNLTVNADTGSGSVFTVSTGTIEFDGVTFSGNNGANSIVDVTGGAIEFKGGTKFTANMVTAVTVTGGTATFTGTNFSGNNTADQVILVNGGTVNLIGASFSANAVNIAVVNVTGSTGNIFNTTYSDNQARALRLANAVANVVCDTVTFTNNAGAIEVNDGKLTLKNTMRFQSNNAGTGNGGGLSISSLGTVTFDSTFSATFSGNSAADGGAIYTGKTISGTDLAKMTFTGNSATASGAALYTIPGVSITAATQKFENNIAGESGGAIYSVGTVTVSGGTFTANAAEVTGGAIHSEGKVTVTGGTFTGNETTSSSATVGAGGGGAICALNDLSIRPSTPGLVKFEKNKANGAEGGAVLVMGGAADIEETIFDDNSAKNGGAIYSAASTKVENCLLKSNLASDTGGAIFAGGAIDIKKSTFASNTANNGGGAVYFPETASENIVDQSLFRENTAGSGGALFLTGNSGQTVTITQSYFDGNRSVFDGGAMDMEGERLNISQSTFTKNEASGMGNGGAIALRSSYYGLVNLTFVDNLAGNQGGGVYFAAGSGSGSDISLPPSAMYYCTFFDNTASMGGGMSAGVGSGLTAGACVFVGNNAPVGSDTYRDMATITSRGYNVIANHGADSSGSGGANVDWKADPSITNSINDKSGATYTELVLFGSAPKLDPNWDKGLTTIYAGSDIKLGVATEALTTLALAPNSATSTIFNPALGIVEGTIATRDFLSFFRTLNVPHTDARGVHRATSSRTPSGGLYCDAGAFQTIDASKPPSGGQIGHVQIGGVPNSVHRVGYTFTLGATVYATNGARLTNQGVRWGSSDPNVVHVDQYGNLVILAIGQSTITVSTVNNSYTGSPATDSVLIKVTDPWEYMVLNTAAKFWQDILGFNRNLASRGVQAYLVDADPSKISASSFAAAFRAHYGVDPVQITSISDTNGLTFRSSSDYRGAISALKPSTGLTMSTLADDGAILVMKYAYSIEWSDVSSILGREVTSVTESDVSELFNNLSLAFTDEKGNNVVLVDKNGAGGVSVADALSSKALKVGGVNTKEFESEQNLVMHLEVLLADAAPTSGKPAALIDDRIVVSDNDANGRIDGDVWLLRETSKNDGDDNGGGGGGGGGGCNAAGFMPGAMAVAAILLALSKRKNGRR